MTGTRVTMWHVMEGTSAVTRCKECHMSHERVNYNYWSVTQSVSQHQRLRPLNTPILWHTALHQMQLSTSILVARHNKYFDNYTFFCKNNFIGSFRFYPPRLPPVSSCQWIILLWTHVWWAGTVVHVYNNVIAGGATFEYKEMWVAGWWWVVPILHYFTVCGKSWQQLVPYQSMRLWVVGI